MENEFNNEKKGNGIKLVIVFLILVIFGLVFYILYDKNIILKRDDNTTKTEEKEVKKDDNIKKDDNEISDDTKKELLSLIGLTLDGHEKMDKETIKELELEGDNWIDLDALDITSFFVHLDPDKEVLMEKLDMDYVKMLLLCLSVHSQYGDSVKLNGDIIPAITKENYKKIAKSYGLLEDGDKIFSKDSIYKDYYLLYSTGALINPVKVDQKLSYKRDSEDIIVTYSLNMDYYSNDELQVDGKKVIDFRFKKHDDGSYYLYSVYIDTNE